jgi:hypothetical protein
MPFRPHVDTAFGRLFCLALGAEFKFVHYFWSEMGMWIHALDLLFWTTRGATGARRLQFMHLAHGTTGAHLR